MQTAIYSALKAATQSNRKQLAVLIDPDKTDAAALNPIAELINLNKVDYVFVGGSLITGSFFGDCIEWLKEHTQTPVILFPGNSLQVHPSADGLLLLSLISGRNPELLIGSHVVAAPMLKSSGLEIISTGYMLIESGKLTSVVYMSNTTPIPSDKPDIALCTAMAGEMLGLKVIYMDAGSGAGRPVPPATIGSVRKNISIPLIVGGGIRCAASAAAAWKAGADVIVVGNALEHDPSFIEELCRERDLANRVQV
ncbi:MAG: geranylgeranylglyceryl/heptaprenylglyceryl phosphate synthase [Bacteroidetes bacterium]|nr:MAG: geranylgeranylglyceryl/heptaprenylglyceryl phosphate synthase [Bacteroidota bacterium]